MSRADDAKHVAALLGKGRLTRSEAAACLVSLAAALLAETPEPDIKPVAPTPPAPDGERLLTAEEVALRLGLDVASVVRRRFPFARKLGRRTVRYSEAGLRKWMRSQGAP